MAAKFPSAFDDQLKPRKGHDMAWSCDEHGDPIKFYCKDHEMPVCHPCATKDHQKPCHLDNIGDVILKMGREVEVTLLKLGEMMQRSKKLMSEIQSSSTLMSNHLETVNDEVDVAFKNKIKIVQDKEQEEIHLINKEADDQIRILNDQIRIVNETRESRIKSSREKSEKKQQSLKDSQAQVIADGKNIYTTVGEKIEELKGKNQHNIDTMDNIGSKIKRIRQDDQALVNEARQVKAPSVIENVHQDILDSLDRLKVEFQRVKFVEGKVGGEDYARIHGYDGKWEIIKSIDIPPIVTFPVKLRGLISNNELYVLDIHGKLFITNIDSGQTHKFITGDNNTTITSCAPVDSNLIVCGRSREATAGNGGRLLGFITLYNRQWKVVRHITLPTRVIRINPGSTYVDVDKDGMILAAEIHQSNIFVINPANGQIVNTIKMQDNKVFDRIQALTSGDIMVQTEPEKFTVISRSGEEKISIHTEFRASCCVDKLTSTICITYWDENNQIHTVDQVSYDDDDNHARRIFEWKHPGAGCSITVQSLLPFFNNSCAITPSGNIVAVPHNGARLMVYKNKFAV